MPMEACRLMRDGENLLTIALTLHMSSMGSSDPLSREEELRLVGIINTALDHWQDGSDFSRDFDDAVMILIIAARDEARSRWRARKFSSEAL